MSTTKSGDMMTIELDVTAMWFYGLFFAVAAATVYFTWMLMNLRSRMVEAEMDFEALRDEHYALCERVAALAAPKAKAKRKPAAKKAPKAPVKAAPSVAEPVATPVAGSSSFSLRQNGLGDVAGMDSSPDGFDRD